MKNISTPIQRFFAALALHMDKGNVPEIIACYAEVFLACGPQGAQSVRAADFALALPKRYSLFESLGCRSTELIGIKENWLDARYVSARTQWRLTFERPGKEALSLIGDSTFLIDTGVEPFRIIVYLAHQDFLETLKQHGINPVY
jgi:hypothetical protein